MEPCVLTQTETDINTEIGLQLGLLFVTFKNGGDFLV